MIPSIHRSLLVVVSAPSGAGKTTLCDRLLKEFHRITYSVSCTTRPPRVGELNGRSYHFVTEKQFQAHVDADDFLEYAQVHGHRYGTLRLPVVEALEHQHDVLMDIDVQGAARIRERIRRAPKSDPLRQALVDIFIAPPSMQDLQMRLFGRGKDEPDVIERRLHQAGEEMAHWREYSYLIVNDRLDDSYDELRAVYLAEHQRIRKEDET
jgi:guanylate kinase